jgi:hypothetical protein
MKIRTIFLKLLLVAPLLVPAHSQPIPSFSDYVPSYIKEHPYLTTMLAATTARDRKSVV